MGISPANHGMLALCYSCKLLRYFLIILIILIYYVVATFKGFICSFRMKTVANSILHWMELPKSSSNASVALVEAAITQTLIWKRWVSMTSIILLLQQPHSGIFLRPLHQKITQGPPVKKTKKRKKTSLNFNQVRFAMLNGKSSESTHHPLDEIACITG